jgi:heat shock protein HtpX
VGLSVRMAFALVLVVLVYLALVLLGLAFLLASILAVDGWSDALWAAAFWLLVGFGLVAVVGQGVEGVERAGLRSVGAKVLDRGEEPELEELVVRLAAEADIPVPRLALARSWAPNAFALGLTPARAIVVVTTELLRRLDGDELEAVIAHELAHVANRDGMVMTFVAGPTLLGAGLWHSDDGRAKLLFFYYFPVFVIGSLLLWTMSRYREYVADRGACLLTGRPEALESALLKIAGTAPRGDLRGGGPVSAFCIVPAQRRLRWWQFFRRFEMFMDHPPIDKRIRRLDEIARDLGKAER